MPQASKFTRCEHCGNEVQNQHYAKHERVCIGKPEVWEKVREAITLEPGLAKSTRDYMDAYPDGPSVMMLKGMLGVDSWPAVCEAFGVRGQEGGRVEGAWKERDWEPEPRKRDARVAKDAPRYDALADKQEWGIPVRPVRQEVLLLGSIRVVRTVSEVGPHGYGGR
jgi:hypothetical protein